MSWRDCTLGDIVNFNYGKALPAKVRVPGAYPVYGSGGLVGTHKDHIVRGPGIVVGRKGTVGATYWVESDFCPIDTTYYVTPKDPETNLRYLYYLLKSLPLSEMNTDAAVPGLNRDNALRVKVKLPDPDIQIRTAIFLARYDDLIDNNLRRISLLEDVAQRLYREWFVNFRFPGHEHVNMRNGIPDNFDVLELGEFCKLRGGNAFKIKFQGQKIGDHPFIKVGDMNSDGNSVSITESNNWISEVEAKELKAKPFPPGTVVFAKIGEALKQNRVRITVRETIIDNNMMGAIPDRRFVSPAFLYYLLSSYDIASHASGAAIPFLTAGTLSKIKFPVPRNSLLADFDSIVEPIQKMITNLQVQITANSEARDLLLPRLMDGMIEI